MLITFTQLSAQPDTLLSRFQFHGDFRFRVEQDWDSRKSDGTFRQDRSRLRYRARVGFVYQHDAYTSVGLRLRTGNPGKQQDPQLTLGDGFKEFGTLPVALEKAFFQTELKIFDLWLGKNTFPFKKQNELFWSDNVFPEGIFVSKTIDPAANWVDQVQFNAGHFILNTRGGAFSGDSYLEGFQIATQYFQDRLAIWPTVYLFRNVQNIPDGAETYFLDYSILNLGGYVKLVKDPLIKLAADVYYNVEDYQANDSIPQNLRNQNMGTTLSLSYGQLSQKGDWLMQLTYAYLERFAAVDFMAQNDWARWDYSAYDSPDGRLTNLEGIELTLGTNIHDKITLKSKYYIVRQLMPLGEFTESGQRIRFDIDIKF